MNFLKKIKSSIKKYSKQIVSIIAGATVLSQLVIPAVSMRADAPCFNFMQGDYELVRGANLTAGESVWKDPVIGNAGDSFLGLIYYHNGVVETVAENTKIKINIPTETSLNSAKISATISADNAPSVNDTVVEGSVVGLNGLTINLDQYANLELIPGSVKWYPNSNGQLNAVTPLPNGQTGNEIISADGINIGNINGCWQYAGFVSFGVKTKAKVVPATLALSKTVKNLSKNESIFVESTSALPSEIVQFKIENTNNGGSASDNVIVSDVLPSDLTVVANSAKLEKSGVISSISESTLLSNGVNIGALAINEKATIIFNATAPKSITTSYKVINTAKTTSGNIALTDMASVDFVAQVPNIVLSKSARNLTQNIDATTRGAGSGDIIEYTLITKNTGTAGIDYMVKDGISDILEYADVINISDDGVLADGTPNTNDAKMVQYPSQNIGAGSEIVRKFSVKIKNSLPTNAVNGFHFDDKMFNVYGNEVVVSIARPTPPVLKPELSIDKFVRNVTLNELDFTKLNTAYSGDMLEYKITFENRGNAPADYVSIYDSLPANVVLDPSASAIIAINGVEQSIAEQITSGYTIKTIAPGDKGYIRFRALTSIGLAEGERLTNNGFLNDHGTVITASAQTIIKQRVVKASVTPITPTKSLPTTGPEAGLAISGIISLIGALNMAYLKQKRSLYRAATNIRVI